MADKKKKAPTKKESVSRPRIRGPYGPRMRVAVDLTEGAKTKQNFKPMCDIRNIMAQFVKTGELIHINRRSPMFMDVSEVPDYRTALDNVIAARELFMKMPVEVRKEFENDETRFLDFLATAEPKELAEYGLITDPIDSSSEESPAGDPEPSGQAEGASVEDVAREEVTESNET